MKKIILGIESSCDETSASICIDGKIINNFIASQNIHNNYGGVVPELASREHQKNIIPIIEASLLNANIIPKNLTAIACTQGPGLLGSLLVGYSFAKAFAFALNIPFINVDHLHAHIFSHFIEDPKPTFPFLCLTVSGGHTQIILVESFIKHTIIGQTKDDAAGEAFDKGAKMLGFSYPGGPFIDKYASLGNENAFDFAKSQINNFDFSFSGIKTSLLYFLKKETDSNPNFIKTHLNDICASYQKTIVDMLVEKLISASKKLKINNIAIAGGVSANKGLRKRLETLALKNKWNIFIPKLEYCTDNAAMVAITGYHYYENGKFASLNDQPYTKFS